MPPDIKFLYREALKGTGHLYVDTVKENTYLIRVMIRVEYMDSAVRPAVRPATVLLYPNKSATDDTLHIHHGVRLDRSLIKTSPKLWNRFNT